MLKTVLEGLISPVTGCDGFFGGMEVEGLEVDCSSGLAILHDVDDHTMTLCYWFANW